MSLVFTIPGWTAALMTPRPPKRRASSFVKSTFASFESQYAPKRVYERFSARPVRTRLAESVTPA